MDGNGRWAKKRGFLRTAGHKKGAQVVETIIEDGYKMGIEYITVYAFSTENWSRSKDEVSALMKLLGDYLVDSIERSTKNNMKVRIIGDKSRLDPYLVKKINELEEKTKDATGLKFTIAINYGGRDEIRRCVCQIASEVKEGKLKPEDIDEDAISARLDTAGLPDPDLLIRTSGEERLSNFLPWQLAYTEFYFTDICWPDFNKEELEKAIDAYNHRTRRFGGLKKGEE
jgi:undecaprenyl diphosphate synthase